MEEMRSLPNESVDLILTDPPYGTIKGMEVIKGGKVINKRNEWDVVVNVEDMLEEFKRVLRPNGKAVIFGNNSYTLELRKHSTSYIQYVYPLYWVKNTYGSPLSAKVAPLSYVEDISVFSKVVADKEKQREYFKKIDDFIGLTTKETAERIGKPYMTVRHFYYGYEPFRIPTEANYNKLIEEFKIDEQEWFIPYGELKKIEREENPSPVFNLPEGKGHVSNVFNVAKDSYGNNAYHPTQKPVDLMEQLIEIYTNEGDVVLDAFMGSGSTGVAALNLGRQFIGIELDDEYFNVAHHRLDEASNNLVE